MSGDVQPRKRKDKKRKKDELSVEEPRGTAATFGEGDVFMHSQHEHGTGGHWCAKIIFFSLLAILITLVGLIILENRGLSELEANSVESRYSGVLEGWLEDVPDDDHHDEHTLELKHHDHDIIGHENEFDDDADDGHHNNGEHDDEDDENNEDGHDDEEDDDNEDSRDGEDDEDDDDNEDGDDNEDDNQGIEDSQEEYLEENDEDEDDKSLFSKYLKGDDDNQEDDDDDQEDDDDNQEDDDDDQEDDDDNQEDDDDDQEDDDDDQEDDDDTQEYDVYDSGETQDPDDNDNDGDVKYEERSVEENYDDDDINEERSFVGNDDIDEDDDDDIENRESNVDSHQIDRDDEDEDHDEENEEEDELELEIERIEREASEEEPISTELPPLPEADEDDDDDDDDNGDGDDDKENDEDDNKDDNDEDSNEADNDDENDEEEEYLEQDLDEDDEPPIERITAPSGKPFDEVEEETSSEKPPDTLEEEEEYEKRQEELRREEEQASHMWLKLGVGGALLLATHAIMRRATTARNDSPSEENESREATPDRRMTLIPEESSEPTTPEISRRVADPIFEEVVKKIPSITKSAPTPKQISEEDEEQEASEEEVKVDKELYSDDENDEEESEEKVEPKKAASELTAKPSLLKNTPAPEEEAEDDEDPDDVEIIDDEAIEEAIEEEIEDEDEEISDVDDAELLNRLEAKYGRLPEPERYGKQKDGGNSVDDEWPGEPVDSFWQEELTAAERELRQGAWDAAASRAGVAGLRGSARAQLIRAQALDRSAEQRRDNALLSAAIAAYVQLLKMQERLNDKQLLLVAERALDRIRFRGNYMSADPVYRLLIRRFPDEVVYRNNLTITYLMVNRADLATDVLRETLKRWPEDRVALAHYGFVLKTHHGKLEEAVEVLRRALAGDAGAANEPRFHYHLGDALLLLGRRDEADEVHRRGAELGHFLSPMQRSLYNVPRLKSKPWWNIEETPYRRFGRELERSWRQILEEAKAAQSLYAQEKEGLRERGEWSQMDLWVRGREVEGRCKQAKVTCAVVSREAGARCSRGQVKFSAMEAGTHVRAHVGPTNCRLRVHLALSNTTDTYIRVGKEIRQWEVGKVLMFDDSFEHEVWHNGTGLRLVLIADVWHPDLTDRERQTLAPI